MRFLAEWVKKKTHSFHDVVTRLPTHLDELRIFLERALQVGAHQGADFIEHIHIGWHEIVFRETKVVRPSVLESRPAPKESRIQENFFQRTCPFKAEQSIVHHKNVRSVEGILLILHIACEKGMATRVPQDCGKAVVRYPVAYSKKQLLLLQRLGGNSE